MANETTETLIIGAGLAGLSFALHHPGEALIVEATDHVGGKAMSERFDGYTFDVTGHWLHLRDAGMKALIFRLLGEDHFHRIERISRIWSHGVYTQYPFQSNVFGLPPAVVHACVMGAIEADRRKGDVRGAADEPENFADWIRFFFGEGIAEHFMVPYNAKLWGVSAEEITSRWCQRFVPKPKLDDIVAGAVGLNASGVGYNASFLYPKHGGIQTLSDALADEVGRDRIRLNTRVTGIDLDRRVAFIGDRTIAFKHLVNTAPLPDFLKGINGLPAEMAAARGRLRATETPYLNVGIEGPLGQPDHWIYVPERAWPMYRVGSFSNAVPAMAPPGHSSLYVELADRATPAEALVPRVIEGLVAMGLIDDPRRVRFVHPRRIPHAYVVYDFAWHDTTAAIHAWLASQRVQSIGRYGEWKYSSMEDAMIDGREAAARLAGGSP
ncbi:MAG: FAD-dependent oxidoreductase [Myxococcales bacterium]|nr:FAD-dependent oxidoreductase [Myxococcales bacterium]